MRNTLIAVLMAIVVAIPAFGQFERNIKMDDAYAITDFDQIAPSNSIATNAASCIYTNNGYTNVEEALNALINPYVPSTVTLYIEGVTSKTYDLGVVLTNAAINWDVNKTMTGRTLTAPTNVAFGAGGDDSWVHTNALVSSQTTYTFQVTDGTTTNTDSAIYYFRNREYWGFNSVTNSIDDSEIQALANSSFATSLGITATGLTPSGTQYIWVCYPESFGAASFTLNGLPSTGWPVETNDFVNAYNYTNSYLRYRSPNVYSVPVNLIVY